MFLKTNKFFLQDYWFFPVRLFTNKRISIISQIIYSFIVNEKLKIVQKEKIEGKKKKYILLNLNRLRLRLAKINLNLTEEEIQKCFKQLMRHNFLYFKEIKKVKNGKEKTFLKFQLCYELELEMKKKLPDREKDISVLYQD